MSSPESMEHSSVKAENLANNLVRAEVLFTSWLQQTVHSIITFYFWIIYNKYFTFMVNTHRIPPVQEVTVWKSRMECEGFLPQVIQGVETNSSVWLGECDTPTVPIQPTGTFPLSTEAATLRIAACCLSVAWVSQGNAY